MLNVLLNNFGKIIVRLSWLLLKGMLFYAGAILLNEKILHV